MTSARQLVDLAGGADHQNVPRYPTWGTGREVHRTLPRRGGLARSSRTGLDASGARSPILRLAARSEPAARPIAGWRPLEADDAGIFFGREAPIIEALDGLRGLAASPTPRLSSFSAPQVRASPPSCARGCAAFGTGGPQFSAVSNHPARASRDQWRCRTSLCVRSCVGAR